MKRAIALVILFCLMFSCVALAENEYPVKKEELVGTWKAYCGFYTLDDILNVLVQDIILEFGFSEDDILYCVPSDFAFIRYITFKEEGNYVLEYDLDETAYQFMYGFDNLVEAIYDHRDECESLQGMKFKNVDEFKEMFANSLEFETYDEYLDFAGKDVADHFLFASEDRLITGTYEVKNGKTYFDGQEFELYFDGSSFYIGDDFYTPAY